MKFQFNFIRKVWLPAFAIIVTIYSTSCSTLNETSKITALKTDYCAPAIKYEQSDSVILTASQPVDPLLNTKLNPHDLKLASHLGLTGIISGSLHSSLPIDRLEHKQKLIEKILLFSTRTEAIVAELDCNGERFDQLARYLDDKNSHTNNRLTVASILTAAAVSVSTALIKNDHVNKGINIGGGVAGAGLGFMLLNPAGKKLKLQTGKGLLTNAWTENNADNAFPPALWRVMTDKTFSNSGKLSLLQTLKERWKLFIFNGDVDADDEIKFFKKGGRFSEEDVQHLADMYNQLQSSVRSVQQDTRSLIEAINRL